MLLGWIHCKLVAPNGLFKDGTQDKEVCSYSMIEFEELFGMSVLNGDLFYVVLNVVF